MVPTDQAKSVERAEEDIAAGVFEVTLCGKPWSVKVKPISEAREFRKIIADLVKEAAGPIFASADDDKDQTAFLGALVSCVMVDGLDKVPALLVAYAPEREAEIKKASDIERLEALNEVLTITFPLLRAIVTMGMRLVRLSQS